MSPDLDAAAPTFPARRLALLILVLATLAGGLAAMMYAFGRTPDWALFARQSAVVHIHVAAALTALLVGTVQLIGIKGTGLHRVIGWIWVIAMLTVAVSSLFIRGINHGSFSWIHLLSGWTLIAVPMALYAIRRGQVARHGSGMVWTFVGGLIIAGAFTFLPGRLMWTVFFG